MRLTASNDKHWLVDQFVKSRTVFFLQLEKADLKGDLNFKVQILTHQSASCAKVQFFRYIQGSADPLKQICCNR